MNKKWNISHGISLALLSLTSLSALIAQEAVPNSSAAPEITYTFHETDSRSGMGNFLRHSIQALHGSKPVGIIIFGSSSWAHLSRKHNQCSLGPLHAPDDKIKQELIKRAYQKLAQEGCPCVQQHATEQEKTLYEQLGARVSIAILSAKGQRQYLMEKNLCTLPEAQKESAFQSDDLMYRMPE